MADALENAGRGTDEVIGHLTPGEIVIPLPLVQDPNFNSVLQAVFRNAGVNINEFTVGHSVNKINPKTGYPEFFIKQAVKEVGKAVGAVVKPVANVVADTLGLQPKIPTPAPPSRPQEARQPATENSANRRRPGVGRSGMGTSTLLTGPSGATNAPVGRSTLLGQ